MTQPLFLDARRDLFGGLIDYAGLFPPASLSLDDAIAAEGPGFARELRRFRTINGLGALLLDAARSVKRAVFR